MTYKGCYSEQETKDSIQETKAWARGSATALEIMDYVDSSEKVIHVVGMRGGYQCFNSTEGPEKDLPVVFVDLDGKLTVNVRTAHNLHLDPNDCQGNVLPLDNKIALLHEFGHAKQWIEKPLMFDNHFVGGGDKSKKFEFAAAIRQRASEVIHRCPKCGEHVEIDAVSKLLLDPKRDKIKHPKALHICAGKPTAAVILPTAKEVAPFEEKKNPEGFKPPVWGTHIEMDNMSRHEWPICREMKLPLRMNYRDINGESDGAPSLTSQIRKKAEQLANQQKKLDETKQVKLAGGKCPYCTEVFKSNSFLNSHIGRVHPDKERVGQ